MVEPADPHAFSTLSNDRHDELPLLFGEIHAVHRVGEQGGLPRQRSPTWDIQIGALGETVSSFKRWLLINQRHVIWPAVHQGVSAGLTHEYFFVLVRAMFKCHDPLARARA